MSVVKASLKRQHTREIQWPLPVIIRGPQELQGFAQRLIASIAHSGLSIKTVTAIRVHGQDTFQNKRAAGILKRSLETVRMGIA